MIVHANAFGKKGMHINRSDDMQTFEDLLRQAGIANNKVAGITYRMRGCGDDCCADLSDNLPDGQIGSVTVIEK